MSDPRPIGVFDSGVGGLTVLGEIRDHLPYENAHNIPQYPTRDRKLLLHRSEISRLTGKSQEDGKTLIPLRIYPRNGNIKLEIAVASRKRQYDKRREIARKTAEREMERAVKERLRR